MDQAVLSGRVVAVTGAGGGLGRAYALHAAAAGARVVVADIQAAAAEAVAAEICQGGAEAVALGVDVAAPGAGERIVDTARDAFGGLDGFVANAALLRPGALLAQSREAIDTALAVNVAGVIDGATAAARAMRDGGCIVVIVSGSLLGAERLALYGTTKAAALGLVYGLAVELADSGVRIMGLAPLAHTAMSDEMGGPASSQGGAPEGIAPAVTYLLSDESRDLNGRVLRFDGVRLGIYQQPRIEHTVQHDRWSVETIAHELSGDLRADVTSAAPAGLGTRR